jgi:PAS domain S-box-containing protein
MVVEITKRKTIEESLKLSEEKYRQIVDTANEGIWVIDNQANTSFVNPQMAEMLGYSSAEMLAKSLFDFIMDKEAQARSSALMEGRRQGITEQHDFKFCRQDGSDLWCLIGTSPILDRAGQFIGALGLVTDISHRFQAEQALRESEEKFRQLAENIQAVLWITDIQNQQILYLSNAYETIWQGKCEDAYQNFSSWLDAVHPDDRQLLETAFIEQKSTGHSDTEYRIIRPDGSLRWIRDRAFPIKDESGKIWRLAGIAEDITDRKQTEEALRQSESILRSFFNSGSMMMGIVKIYPHDIFHLSSHIATTEFFGTTAEAMQNRFASEIGAPQEFIEMWLHYPSNSPIFGSQCHSEYCCY